MTITNHIIKTNCFNSISGLVEHKSSVFVQHFKDTLPKIALGVGVLIAFWITAIIISYIIKRVSKGVGEEREEVIFLLSRISYISLVFVGVISGLGTIGVNIMPLITGLGLTGFALGYAFKDLLSNVLAGVMIIIHRPFIVGDEITVANLTGKIVNIDLRYTALTADNKIYLIPNTSLMTNPITITNAKETKYHEKRFGLKNE